MEVRTDLIKETIVDGILYVFDDEAYEIPSAMVTTAVTTIYVPENSVDDYKEINDDYKEMIYPYSYSGVRLTKEPFYDNVAVIMTSGSNAPMMNVMYTKGLAAHQDYMTLAEAKAVINEDCTKLLDGNSAVTSFNEFQYFTNVTNCGEFFARNAINLESIILPKSLRIIPPRMFTITTAVWNSGSRGHLKYVGNTEQIEEVGQVAFQYQNQPFSLNFTQKLKKIGVSAFVGGYNSRDLNDMTMSTYITSFGDLSGVEEIVINPSNNGSFTFIAQQNLKSIDMPKITRIPIQMFINCQNLSSINFDWDNLTLIDDYALVNTAIERIPNCPMLTKLGQYALNWCKNMKYVGDIPLVTTISKAAFMDCRKLQEVGDIHSVTTISDYAFTNDRELYKIGRMDNVVSIGKEAFAGCNKLSAYFPNCTSVGKWAFGVDYEKDYKRTIEFGKSFDEISFNSETFVISHDNEILPCTNTTIICNGIELTAEQYQAVGAQKPEA